MNNKGRWGSSWSTAGIIGLLALAWSWAAIGADVSGAIDASATWSLAQSPYRVTADVTVSSGATLTIEAGVIVRFEPGTNLTVSAGALRALGTSDAPIIFTSVADDGAGTPAPGDWGSLRFLDGTNDGIAIVEHAQVRYGQGIVIESASPVLNHLTITNNAGAAIRADLASSPTGVGLQATGNGINGIVVPAGEIAGSLRWGLKGMPYVVDQGTVHVGASPNITSVQPATIQVGQTLDVVLSGTRLGGAESVSFDATGVNATLSGASSDTSISLRVTADVTQPLGNVGFTVQAAAGKARFDAGIVVVPAKPTIVASSINPTSLRREESKSFQISGNYLQGAQISVPSGSGLTLTNLQTTDTQAAFTLSASASAALGAQALTLTNTAIANGSAVVSVDVANTLPKVYTNPSPLAVSPTGGARSFLLRLTNTDTIAHTLNLSVLDPTIVTVSPLTLTIPAGVGEVPVSITGHKLGYTVLNITSPTLPPAAVQIFVTDLLNGAVVGPVTSESVAVYRPMDASSLPAGTVISPTVSLPVEVYKPIDAGALPVGTVIGPTVSSPVEVYRPMDASSLPAGTVISPTVSLPVEVYKPIDAGALPVGTVIGPTVSSPVEVYKPIDASSLPAGTVIGPTVSPPVEVTVP